jgi:hypothetical protein
MIPHNIRMHFARIAICCIVASSSSVFAGSAVPVAASMPAYAGSVERVVSAASPKLPATQSESKDEKPVSVLPSPVSETKTGLSSESIPASSKAWSLYSQQSLEQFEIFLSRYQQGCGAESKATGDGLKIRIFGHRPHVFELDRKMPFLEHTTEVDILQLSRENAKKMGPRLPNIHKLKILGGVDTIGPLLALLGGLPNKSKLTNLAIKMPEIRPQHFDSTVMEQFIAALRGYTGLRELELDFGWGSSVVLRSVPNPSMLHHLSLSNVTAEQSAFVGSELKRFNNVGELTVSQEGNRNAFIATSAIATALPNPAALSSLRFDFKNVIGDSSDLLISPIRRFLNLRKLFFYTDLFIETETCSVLAAVHNKGALSGLHFSVNLMDFHKPGACFIPVLAEFLNLRELSIVVPAREYYTSEKLGVSQAKAMLNVIPNKAGISRLAVENIVNDTNVEQDSAVAQDSEIFLATIPSGYTGIGTLDLTRHPTYRNVISISSSSSCR